LKFRVVAASSRDLLRARLGVAWLLIAAPFASAGAHPLHPAIRGAPDPPALIGPTASSALATMPANLAATVSDPDGDSLTVTFYGRPVTAAGRPDFTLIEIPDTQYYTSYMNGGSPAYFLGQTQWIAAQRLIRNIAYVAHVGDLVEHEDNGGNPVEWIAADACMKPLEDPDATLLPDGIPYGSSPGNHDIAGSGALMFYNQFFGVPRFQGRSYYGGHYGADNANWFELFSASGLDFIVIGLKLTWIQNPGPVHWADSLLSAYPDRKAIIVSHYLLDPGPPATFSPQGQAIYDGLKGHANLMLMICGHYVNDARRSDTWNGHTVHTVMANYQNLAFGGNGWLRIMEFSPVHDQIRMRTFSPWLTQFRTLPDSSSQFTLSCDLGGGDLDFHPIATFRRVASGSSVSIPWAGLQRNQNYEWYVTVSDGASTVTGPTWAFQGIEDVPPTVHVASPNGGEALTMGQQASLEWDAADASGMMDVDLYLSRTGPAGPWDPVELGVPNSGSFRWWVTGPPTVDAYLRVSARDIFFNQAVDMSDSPFQIIGTTAVGAGPAGPLALEPVAPNPTTGASRFGVVLPAAGGLRLEIVDIGGRRVATIAHGFQPAGRREYAWDGRAAGVRAPAGVYFVRLEAAGRVLTRRFTIAG
jgi:3',5'-cyclic AMP phosphodiesterase CpdA